MKDDIITIPIQATYRMVGGEPVLVSAEYADVSADRIARLLMEGFHIPIDEEAMPCL